MTRDLIEAHLAEHRRTMEGVAAELTGAIAGCAELLCARPCRRRQGAGDGQRRFGGGRPAPGGRAGRALPARAPGAAGRGAHHRQLDSDRGRQRLRFRTNFLPPGRGAGRARRRGDRHLHQRQLGQRPGCPGRRQTDRLQDRRPARRQRRRHRRRASTWRWWCRPPRRRASRRPTRPSSTSSATWSSAPCAAIRAPPPGSRHEQAVSSRRPRRGAHLFDPQPRQQGQRQRALRPTAAGRRELRRVLRRPARSARRAGAARGGRRGGRGAAQGAPGDPGHGRPRHQVRAAAGAARP